MKIKVTQTIDLNLLTQEEQIAYVSKSVKRIYINDGPANPIKHITNPSLEVQLAAVTSDWKAIKYITNPSLEVQLAAVKFNATATFFIKKVGVEVQIEAIKTNARTALSALTPDDGCAYSMVSKKDAPLYSNAVLEFLLTLNIKDKYTVRRIKEYKKLIK
jgi:hypothetical protein